MVDTLQINVGESVLVRELLSLAERVIKVGLKLKAVTKEHIKTWRKANKETPVNGPPTLGVKASDDTSTEDVFG